MIVHKNEGKEIQWERKYKGGSIFADESAILKPEELEWLPGPLEGLFLKITFADPNTGDWTAQIKLEPHAIFPKHINHAEVHFFVLKGQFETEYGVLRQDDYMRDPGGLVPERKAGSDGVTFFVKFLGGISAADENGKSVGPYVDALYVRELAAKHGADAILFTPSR